MPDFDLCRMEWTEFAVFGVLYVCLACAVGSAFAKLLDVLTSPNGLVRFSVGFLAPMAITAFLGLQIAWAASPSECGFTPDSIALGLYAIVAPLIAPFVVLKFAK